MAVKHYDKLNSIKQRRKIFLNDPASKSPNTPSFTVLFEINISLSVLKGNYIENLYHNIITDTSIISFAISQNCVSRWLCLMSFEAFKISQTSN